MLEFLFDLPSIVVGPAIVVAVCEFAMVGLTLVRRRVLPRWRITVAAWDCSPSRTV